MWHCGLLCGELLYLLCVDSPTMVRWMVSLDPMEAGGPHVITATAGNVSITLNDVLFGDVWICSGQSNMQFTVPSVRSHFCSAASSVCVYLGI